ncbi:hypothetical protein AMS68_000464 [Peltaster fructicola]|uniref:Amidohydrolase-related domain-containing protein n=1 Tax=Peltaster fructicola TaxID=286661 RepID=A0A6H0XJP0_9PEZI|nr:hypothetical protein AMS68_000464 [Peltaster fructicola]
MTVVDVHTHFYPDAFMDLLRSRTEVPYVRSFPDNPAAGDRLVILPAEDTASTSRGRPIGPEYYDIKEKIKFMDQHRIDISVISLANPWLDFVDPAEASNMARLVNDNMNQLCAESGGRLYAFGTLPLSAPVAEIVQEIKRLATLKYMRGVIMGTSGCGKGLDDPALDDVYEALQTNGQFIFLHPHYGLPSSLYGPYANDYGHVLPLALGFPLETTIAITRMILSKVFDRHKTLSVLIAHSGGTLPFLAGRIASCIAHDAHLKKEGQLVTRKSVFDLLKQNFYLDAVIYDKIGLRAAIDAAGAARIMFGTDHPFFPPLDDEEGQDEWLSVSLNTSAIKEAVGDDENELAAIMGETAIEMLRLDQSKAGD